MLVGLLLALIQFVAAVPWLLVVARFTSRPKGGDEGAAKKPILPPGGALQFLLESLLRKLALARLGPVAVLALGLVTALVAGAGLGLLLETTSNPDRLETLGRAYASILQLQLYADVFVIAFAIILWLWPKGGAVARASFREGYRQPMFWMLFGSAVGLLILSPFVPYFTFGEDYIMVKELGFDIIMMTAATLGVLAAAMSITEEIEGRTAVTLMSKPVSRRQFLLGKFLGIFLCCLLLILAAGWLFDLVLLYKRWFERMDPVPLSPELTAWVGGLPIGFSEKQLARGIVLWARDTSEVVPGLVMVASLVMILVAVAVTLATRLPLIVNLVLCLVIYFLANLMPVLVLSTKPDNPATAGPVQKLLHFTAQLFDTLLPGLELFRVRPTLVDETTLPLGDYVRHAASVSLYGVLFTAIVLLLGLVLFEDRDLA